MNTNKSNRLGETKALNIKCRKGHAAYTALKDGRTRKAVMAKAVEALNGSVAQAAAGLRKAGQAMSQASIKIVIPAKAASEEAQRICNGMWSPELSPECDPVLNKEPCALEITCQQYAYLHPPK